MADLTTKMLGEAIAEAVVRAWDDDMRGRTMDAEALYLCECALFRVLEEHGCWFCRIYQRADGATIEVQMEMFK